MSRGLRTDYRRYRGPLSPGGLFAWWPITRTELAVRCLRWRLLPVLLVAFAPFLFREALLYAWFVVAPVRVRVMNAMTRQMSQLMQWDSIDFYAGYLDDAFLWLLLLVVAAVLGVPTVARDLRTRAWEIYFSRGVSRRGYFIGKFTAIFLVLFAMTWGGVAALYLTTSLLGPESSFFIDNLHWMLPITGYAVLVSGSLALLALAFGTLSRNGIILSGAWLAIFAAAFSASRVMRAVRPDGAFDWIDPRYLFLRASAAIHGHAPGPSFSAWTAFAGIGLLVVAAVVVLGRFLRRREEGIG